jgi:hypothetical protein
MGSAKAQRPYAEDHIWRPLAQRPRHLGHPSALSLHQVQIGNQSGYADLLVLPQTGPTKLVVVEAKRAGDRRSSADVVGQLLKYYAHALDLGSDGLAALTAFAREARRTGVRPRLLSFKQVLGTRSLKEAQKRAARGAPLKPRNLQLVVALDADARKFEPRLLKIAALLCTRHCIPIGVIVVGNRGSRWLCRPDGMAVPGRSR